MSKALNPVDVNFGVQVVVPYERFQTLLGLEEEKQKMAHHVEEHNRNFAKMELSLKEANDKLADSETIKSLYESTQEELALVRKQLEEVGATKAHVELPKGNKKASPKKK